jgi:PAS domain S-box-containing protein
MEKAAMLDEYRRALAANETRFHNLIEKLADGVLVVNAGGAIRYVNPAAEMLLGRRRDELIGELFGRPLAGGEIAEIDLCPAPRRRTAGDDDFAALNSLSRTAEMRVVEIEWEGEPAFLATLRDITERKEAVRRRDEFLAMLAHELRNPLAPILNAVQLIRRNCLSTTEMEYPLAIVERQSKHLAQLFDELLDLSRVTHGKIELGKQALDLRTILTDALHASQIAIEERQLDLTLALPPEAVYVEGDATRLTQVIVNLLNNATKYTDPGGRIEVSLRSDDADAILSVKDTGVGISPSQLSSIFEPFMQLNVSLARERGGLGIGLTLVRHLVELHGGTITAHSAGLGQGSEFIVRLPRGVRFASPSSSPNRTPFVPRRILLVEDNPDGREMFQELLRCWGHQVEAVGDGRDGLNAIRRQLPDVALIDLGLPGLDGYELARRVRALPDGDKVCLIAVTGYGQAEDRRRTLEAGFNAHLVKPVDLSKLEQLFAELPAS